MIKDIEYYLGLPYTRELIPDPEGGWYVRIKELIGCMSQGETPDEAINMIEDAMRLWLRMELKKGHPIPEPRSRELYSGKFVVRVPKALHRSLVELSELEGVSLNQWISSALAEAIGKAPKVDVANQLIEILSPLITKINALEERIEELSQPLDLTSYRSSDFASKEKLIINKYVEHITRGAKTKDSVAKIYYSSIESVQ